MRLAPPPPPPSHLFGNFSWVLSGRHGRQGLLVVLLDELERGALPPLDHAHATNGSHVSMRARALGRGRVHVKLFLAPGASSTRHGQG